MNFRNFLLRLRSIMLRRRPIILYHKPTSRCDCRCKFCNFWKEQSEKRDVLATDVILSMLENAREAGFVTYTLWGGEPLLVEDLPAWLKKAKELGFETVMCTSGAKLKSRAGEIAPYLDTLLLSLEGTGRKHDRIRGREGLFKKILSGINEYRKHSGGKITIWSNIGRHNKDYIENIAEFARESEVNVEFFPTSLYSGYNDDLILGEDERKSVFSNVIDLKEEGYPISNTLYALKLMRSSEKYRCNMPSLSVQVTPDGEIYPCEPSLILESKTYGNVKNIDFKNIVKTELYKRAKFELNLCNACLLPCVAHTADSLPVQSVRRFINNLKY